MFNDNVWVEIAKQLIVKKPNVGKYIEVVKRCGDGKIQKIVKIAVDQVGDSSKNQLEKAVFKNLGSSLGGIQNIGNVCGTIFSVGNGIYQDVKLKEISVNVAAISKMLKTTTSLVWINTGLSFINLSASVIGFSVMNAKLNRISDTMGEIKEKVSQLTKKNEIDIVREFKEVKQNYADMLNAIKIHSEYSEEKYYALTTKMYSVLDYLYQSYMGDVVDNKDAILDAIFALLPMYANVIGKYDAVYYYKHKDVSQDDPWHNSHKDWESIFTLFRGREFLDKLLDYCFLEKNLNSREALNAVYTSFLIVYNGETVIEDTQEILQCFDTYQEYINFENRTTEVAAELIAKDVTEVDEETAKLINPSIMHAANSLTLALE